MFYDLNLEKAQAFAARRKRVVAFYAQERQQSILAEDDFEEIAVVSPGFARSFQRAALYSLGSTEKPFDVPGF